MHQRRLGHDRLLRGSDALFDLRIITHNYSDDQGCEKRKTYFSRPEVAPVFQTGRPACLSERFL